MAKVVYIDTDECIGCESCVGICPEVFSFDDSAGKARVSNPDGAPEEKIQEAIDTCPVQCIHWEE
jgi:ferredoxin